MPMDEHNEPAWYNTIRFHIKIWKFFFESLIYLEQAWSIFAICSDSDPFVKDEMLENVQSV